MSPKVKVRATDFYLIGGGLGPGYSPMICHIRIIWNGVHDHEGPVIIYSELENNPGASVTNCYQRLIQEIRLALIEKGQIKEETFPRALVEHYCDRIVYGDPAGADRYAMPTADKDGGRARLSPLPFGIDHFARALTLPVEAFLIPEERLVCPDHLLERVQARQPQARSPQAVCRLISDRDDEDGIFFENLF